MTYEEHFTAPYRDFLQAPLQPLMDNLESQTYETFEKDPVKYAQVTTPTIAPSLLFVLRFSRMCWCSMQYEAAIALALQDKMKEIDTNARPVTVMVVGAGRGPLVAATLNASHSTGCPVKVYAVEKVRTSIDWCAECVCMR